MENAITFCALDDMKRSNIKKPSHLQRETRMSIAATRKKVSLDLPDSLYEETEAVVREQHTTTSALLRQALEKYLAELRQQKLERELEEGYLANAAVAEQTMKDFEYVDAERV